MTVKTDSLGRPVQVIPENHPRRNFNFADREKKGKPDRIAKPDLVATKKAMDEMKARREMRGIYEAMNGWDLL